MELLKACPICNHTKLNNYLSSNDYFLSGQDFEIVACDNCGFRFTNPRPEADKLGSYYKSNDYISHSNKSKGVFSTAYQLVRNYTLSQKQKLIEMYSAKGTILDIGCATGHFLNQMQKIGWKTLGIEPDSDTRNKAIDTFGLQVFDELKLETIPKGSIDVITMWHVLEHVADLNARVAQLEKLVSEKGVVFIAVPNSNSYDAAYYKKQWAAYDVPRHLYHFTINDISLLFSNYGFKLEKTIPMKFDSFYVSLLSEKYKTGKMKIFSAFWIALISNVKFGRKNGYSSQIFVFKKK